MKNFGLFAALLLTGLCLGIPQPLFASGQECVHSGEVTSPAHEIQVKSRLFRRFLTVVTTGLQPTETIQLKLT